MSLAASSVSRAFSRDLTAASDRELVATAVSGVEGSFEELVRRYQRPISAYVYRMVVGPEGDQFDLPVESTRLTPEQESERKERRGEIESVVRTLPANYRELIILRHSQDLSYEEIVDVTGLPLGTVKNRLFRAREMMRQQFIERGITGI
jgi:DNA-directed RNA polymerase specialized sigma subunit